MGDGVETNLFRGLQAVKISIQINSAGDPVQDVDTATLISSTHLPPLNMHTPPAAPANEWVHNLTLT